MTRLYNDPRAFADEMLAGFADAHSRYVTRVPGGVVRAAETPAGKVAVVVGGGSGHYPAFCGVVGAGFADGAVVGHVFTSPSTQDAVSVGRAAASDAGLLFITGNYAGDVMNFTLARDRLAAEGVDARVLFVTDDIASAPADEAGKRRGIAGDFVVFKVAGAAAEEGYSLDEVERVARHANDRTRTLGVAFGGCTLPGDPAPLFSVPAGRMGVGLGIHGEPGISEEELPSARDLARRLVDGVLAEVPADGERRLGVILNGLGTTKHEELFIVWRSVAELLAERGFTVVEPEVGELVTSLDMAGCSLTVVPLDDELERLWRASADTPAYRKGAVAAAPAGVRRRAEQASDAGQEVERAGSAASRACAVTAVRALGAMSERLREAEAELGRIDAVAGDGDHGRGMVNGVSAALKGATTAAGRGAGAGSVLAAAGDAWAAKAGGTSGVLWGAILRAVGDELGDQGDEVPAARVAAAVRAGVAELRRLGKVEVGDKTMLDALAPFADALDAGVAAHRPLADAWAEAAQAAGRAAEATAALRPRVGRARPLAEKSVGTPDAGALSMAMCLDVVARELAAE
ncbi:dihydroxyacetone kinase family protein [Microtetraspora malaysiensis]|uniref:dihydroxyacetone kinase family protein n=1 Tax=Microtetraspora malaysiensis TaxID=161358 RepID=UPI00082A8E33|nr:dihydroxyacetone kinase family protein [Microtetraspora malaysiensis]